MKEIQKLSDDKKKRKWGNKVRFIALGLDQDIQQQQKAISERNYTTAFEHYNVKADPECKAHKYFFASTLPHAALIDKKGKIAFLGNPSWRTLGADITKLLKGDQLSGLGCLPT